MKRKKHNVPTVDNIIGNFAGRPVRVIIVAVFINCYYISVILAFD